MDIRSSSFLKTFFLKMRIILVSLHFLVFLYEVAFTHSFMARYIE